MKLVFGILTLVTIFTLNSQAQGPSPLCQVPKKEKLAVDQRDEWRENCLKQKKSEINVHQCLQIAGSMEYSNNAEESRMACMDLRGALSLKECVTISKAMEYADSGDEVRWECLRRFTRELSRKQCKFLASSMSYPANSQRAQVFCSQELP